MECNKEEAIRARKTAETKMQTNDFSGAQKIALRAQQIYPELENVRHLLAVCDVHRASEQKIASDDLDWYGILQIEQTVDESLIKKQYRKLALLLHPDKNKFSGAEAAFKLIGEAQRVLLDPIKRRIHDMKRRVGVGQKSVCNSKQKTRDSSICEKQISSQPIDMGPQREPQRSTQARSSSNHSIPNMNKVTCCHPCKKPFVSMETNRQIKTRGDQSVSGQHGASRTASASSEKAQVNVCVENMRAIPSHNAHRDTARNRENRGSNIVNNKRKRSEIDESCKGLFADSREDANNDTKVGCGKNFGLNGDGRPKRYTPPKIYSPIKMAKGTVASGNHSQSVSYKSNVCCMNLQAGCATDQWNSEQDSSRRQVNPSGKKVQEIYKSYSSNEGGREEGSVSAPKIECPDWQNTNCNDLHKIREEKGFTAGQVWALYHPFDTMPRFYVIVKAVYRSKFKLRIVWLEPDPDHEVGVEMGNCDLPRAWGKFVEGASDIMDNLFTISHQMIWEKGGGKDKYKIYPRKGETWAIFKNWNTNWDFESRSEGACKFELVEVLSGYVEGLGVCVIYLSKVKGFTSIFCAEGKMAFQIPPEEMPKFSHRIPSFQMLGEEKKGIPRGSMELDPAAIPPGIEAANVPDALRVQTEDCNPSSDENSTVTATGESEQIGIRNETGALNHKCFRSESDPIIRDATTKENENPEPEFYAFEVNRSKDKFQVGQVWAIYGDTGIPRHYGRIKCIISSAEFRLEVNRLIPCPDQDNRIKWHNRWMPFGCGKFKLSKAKPEVMCPADFSHHLSTVSRGKKCTFSIFPRYGEVWALYKNWKANMCFSKIKHCEYDIVEVMGGDDLMMEVLLLQPVSGLHSVFECRVNHNESKVTWRISRTELLRFSHHIPAVRHADEKQGSIRGLWELDPAAVPQAILLSS